MKGILIVLTALLTGCTAMGYVATTDPDRLLRQGQSMFFQGRLGVGEMAVADALWQFEQRDDIAGMADAHYTLGLLYENDLYHNEHWKWDFERSGTWDGTYMKSIANFVEAQQLFEQLGDENGVVLSIFGIGYAHAKRHESQKACDLFTEALTRFQDASRSGQQLIEHPMWVGYENSGALIVAHLAKESCDTGDLDAEAAAEVAAELAAEAAAQAAAEAVAEAVAKTNRDYQILKGLVRVSYQQQESDPQVLDRLAGIAWRDRGTEDKELVDTLSWICRVLGQSQNPRYTMVLSKLASEASEKKLRKYAQVGLALLPDEVSIQFEPEIHGTIE